MHEKASDAGAVSWKLFKDFYDSQYDLLRKLKFIVQARQVKNSESLALEVIADYFEGKEVELKDIRQAGLEEWVRSRNTVCLQRTFSREMPQNER